MQWKNNCMYIKKIREERIQIQYFYSDSMEPNLRPLSSSFNSKLEVPLIQGFQTKHLSNTIGLWFQSTLLDFWLQAPFTILKWYLTFEKSPKWHSTLGNP